MSTPEIARVVGDADAEEYALARQRVLAEQLLLERRTMHRREIMRRRRRARIRRNRMLAWVGVAALSTIGWFAAAAAGAAGHRPQVIAIEPELHSSVTVPGHLAAFSWPKTGQGAVAVMGEGVVAHSPGESAVPIASLTKMMTALVVLQDHPIAYNASGPSLVMNASDVADYVRASQTDESNAPVALGEVLSERQLLEALLLPSADNIADTLAVWDAGSVAKFVTKMNAEAKLLGLSDTHYADASGVDLSSESTAANQAVVASHLMGNAAVRSIVRLPTVAFPVAGHIWTVNPALGVDGIVGIKSGYTSHALGCLATAAFRPVGTHSALVISVTLSQPDGLFGAARSDETLLDQMSTQLLSYTPVRASEPLGEIGPTDGAVQPLALAGPPPSIVAWPGLRLEQRLVVAKHPSPGRAGSLELSTGYGTVSATRLVYTSTGTPAANTGVPSTVQANSGVPASSS